MARFPISGSTSCTPLRSKAELGNVLVELCPEGDFSEKIPTGAGPYCKKSGPLRAFLSVRCQHFVVASHLWGFGGRLACSVQAISAIYGKQDGRNRRDRDYCVCSDLLAMDTEGAQMTHPKRSRDPNHVAKLIIDIAQEKLDREEADN
jgi:hypothetical protein